MSTAPDMLPDEIRDALPTLLRVALEALMISSPDVPEWDVPVTVIAALYRWAHPGETLPEWIDPDMAWCQRHRHYVPDGSLCARSTAPVYPYL